MPVLTSPEFATKFKEKWLRLHPENEGNASSSVQLDDSLTSLHWLQDFSILGANLDRPPSSCYWQSEPRGSSPPAGDMAATGMPRGPGTPLAYGSATVRLNRARQERVATPEIPGEETDYRTNPLVKPPYSYATLICMAMRASKETKITLSAIYSWITENFPYYRHAEPSWQNSVRYNLSVNKCFRKVPRQKDEPGKGGFWQIDPQYIDTLVHGVFKYRRMRASRFNHQKQSKTLPSLDSTFNSPELTCRQQQNGHQLGFGFLETNQGPWTGEILANKPKQSADMQTSMIAKHAEEQLLVNDAEAVREEFNWSSMSEDAASDKCITFEDLDISALQAFLYSELDICMQVQPVAGVENWTSSGLEQSYGYTDAYGIMGGVICNPLQQQYTPMFPQNQEQLQCPWKELKREVQTDLLTEEEDRLPVCEGFAGDMQTLDRAEFYL
ncbi:forkhead box protein J1-B-like [Arapaima gigas]